MDILGIFKILFLVISIVMTAFTFYQLIYILIGLFSRRVKSCMGRVVYHRYAAVIPARNEEKVIANIIASLKAQRYPAHLLDIYVLADNCTDDTALKAAEAGAIVYERHNSELKGKGYAMDWFFDRLAEEGKDTYDAYMVFDADNIVDPAFTSEMNHMFGTGKYGAITSYRNSTNFGRNWITAGYAIWFLREARYLNRPRQLLGTNCHISGTGFMISADLIRKNGGWPYNLLTEDIQFSVDCARNGVRIGFCENAVVYDEQPETFRQSWDQRVRWSRGFLQVNARYGISIIRQIFSKDLRHRWSCYDMFALIIPSVMGVILPFAAAAGLVLLLMMIPEFAVPGAAAALGSSILESLAVYYTGMFAYGLLTTVTEWKHIRTTPLRKILYNFTFPFFMITYVPINLAAFFKREVTWKHIEHLGTHASNVIQ